MNVQALIKELDSAVGHGTAERRAEILARLTDVFVTGSTSYTDDQIEFFDDVFVRIAAAIESSARAALANRLAARRRRRSDQPGAGNRRRYRRCRPGADALAAARRRPSRRHRADQEPAAPARHFAAHSLAEPVTDVLIERGEKPVILSAASNRAARFSIAGYRTLVTRSTGDDELTTCLALRPDIPRQHLLRLLVRASHDVQRKLAAMHPELAETIRHAVAAAANRILDTQTRNYDAARARPNRCSRLASSAKTRSTVSLRRRNSRRRRRRLRR